MAKWNSQAWGHEKHAIPPLRQHADTIQASQQNISFPLRASALPKVLDFEL